MSSIKTMFFAPDLSSKAPYVLLYEDKDVLLVYKKYHVLSVATSDKKTFHHNLEYYLKTYCRRKGEDCLLVHRLDYETSGLLIFAKNKKMLSYLKSCFAEQTAVRDYEAVVKEDFIKKAEVRQYLTSGYRPNVTDEEEGKLAITEVEGRNRIQLGQVLSIRIKTGRHHQIRLALHSLDLTLIGESIYAHDKAKRMYLNAYHLAIPGNEKFPGYDFKAKPLWLVD